MNETNKKQSIVKFDIDGAKLALESYRENMELLKNEYSDIPDCTTKEGYETARVRIGKLVKFRGKVDKKRKELKADALKYNKEVEAGAQSIIADVKSIEGPIKEAKATIDDAKQREKEEAERVERERRDRLNSEIEQIRSLGTLSIDDDSASLSGRAEKLKRTELISEHFGDMYSSALLAKSDTVEKLESMVLVAQEREEKAEVERLENERVAKEQAEKEKKLRKEREEFETQKAEQEKERARLQEIEDERIAKEREEQKARDDERARLQKIEDDERAAEQAEIDRQKAELAEQKRKQDEKERLEVEAKEKAEMARKDKETQASNRDDICLALSELDDIGEVADGLMRGKIPHVKYVG